MGRRTVERGSTLEGQRIRSIVVIEVTDPAPLISPVYDDGAPEELIVRRWLDYYGELYPR